MDFFILLGFKMLFDLFFPEPKATTRQSEPSTEAAFWFGTSYENIDKTNSGYKDRFENNQGDQNSHSSISDYENIW